jgi:hypothetical protein
MFFCLYLPQKSVIKHHQPTKVLMNRKFYFLIPMVAVILFTAYGPAYNPDHSNGAPAGYTGSPGDGKNCTNCHGGSATTLAGIITSNIPAQGYTAGSSYTITVSLSGSGQKGFEVSPQNASGTLLGTLTAGSGSKLVGSGKYCTHNASVGGSSATWNFSWVAPVAGTGTVTFYGAFTITEPVTKLSTLVVNEYTIVPLGVVATATPSTILIGNSSQLNATASGGSGTYTYSWTSNPAGFTSTQQNPTVSPTVTTQYTVTANDGAGNASNSTTVTVVPANLAVVANANPANINSGQTSQLTANATGGSGAYTFSWTSIPSGFFSTQQNPVVSPTITTQYIVQANDGYQVKSDTTTVDVTSAVFAINATATPGTICSGQSSQLNVTASGGSGNYTYSWTSIPAGFTSNIQNPVVFPTQTTQYVSHVSDGTQSLTDTTHVTVNAPPAAAAGNDTTDCVSVTDIPLHGIASGYSSVLWTTNGDGTFVNATSLNTIYHPGAGDKTNLVVNLTLTASPLVPCTNAAASTRIIHFDPCGVGIPGLTGYTFSFSLRPNPSTGIFTIYSSSVNNEDVMIRIIDLSGKTVLNEKISVSGDTMESKMDLSGFEKGIYFVRIASGNGVKTEKLILQ